MSAVGDFGEVIERYFPYDGPYSGDSVVDAVYGAATLVRYLANATSAGDAEGTLDRGPTTYRVLGGVESLVGGLDQVLGQLADGLERLAGDATLYDDRRDRSGARTAREVAGLVREARRWSDAAAVAVAAGRDAASHLGHESGSRPTGRGAVR